jgi:hypothetical protein
VSRASPIASGASPNPPSAVPWRSSRLGGAPIASGHSPAASGFTTHVPLTLLIAEMPWKHFRRCGR